VNLNRLRTFHVVAREGSITRAAKTLVVTVPTVSESIRKLEADIGVVLFSRDNFGMSMTEAGRLLYRRTTSIFAEVQRALDELGVVEEVGAGSDIERDIRSSRDALDRLLAKIESGQVVVNGDGR
jgi:DNA-binding transcriptional LysR family regulator